MNEEIRCLLGQCLAVGFDGVEIPAEYAELVRRWKIGNVVLFRRNVGTFDQLRALCRGLRDLIQTETGLPPFLLAGEEGGGVSRLAPLSGPTPCPMAVGATGDPENARRMGAILGRRLRAVGVNVDMAPVLDCFSNPDNAVIGNRSFGVTPETVTAFGLAFMQGLQAAGVLACGKHFPGHGDTAVDSHLSLPVIRKTKEEMQKTELVSFRAAVDAGIASLMTAHVVVPSMEPERLPATVSKRFMTDLLRREWGFEGLLFSDGMEMKAVLDLYGIEEAVRRALAAGCDVALICHSVEQAASNMEYLEKAVEAGTLPLEVLRERNRRIAAWKQRIQNPEGTEAECFGETSRQVARSIMTQAIQVLYAPENKPLPPIGKDTLFWGVPARPASIAGDAEALNAAAWMAEALGGHAAQIEPEEANGNQARDAVAFLSPHPDLPALQETVRRLANAGMPVVAVSLYTPRCLDALPDSVWKVCAWQYDTLALETLRDFFVSHTEKNHG